MHNVFKIHFLVGIASAILNKTYIKMFNATALTFNIISYRGDIYL